MYTCLCCGYVTLYSSMFSICPICFWEDDPHCWNDPSDTGGPNGGESLYQAQENFIACTRNGKPTCEHGRLPIEIDVKDQSWTPFRKHYLYFRRGERKS